MDLASDPITEFGVLEARRHRERGITLPVFLGLAKYYRQCYLDLIAQAGFDTDYQTHCSHFTHRFWDCFEIGICGEWTAVPHEEALRELQDTNRRLTNEKNRYLTTFESAANPVFLVDAEGVLVNANHAASKLFLEGVVPGGVYYSEATLPETPQWLCEVLDGNTGAGSGTGPLEVELDTSIGRRQYEATVAPMLDYSGKSDGSVVVLTDITDRKRGEQALTESRDREQDFRERLAALHQITLELSSMDSTNELCRRAVELGRDVLGFERLGIWLLTDDPQQVRGTYGIDESGALRDERDQVVSISPESTMGRVLALRDRLVVETGVPLLNDRSEVVGQGQSVQAAMWDGDTVVGCLCTDNLLQGGTWSDARTELVALYALSLGHLCVGIRREEALRESEEFIRAVMDGLPVGLSVNSVDPSVDFTYMNDNFPLFYGTSKEALADPDVFWESVYEDSGFRQEIRDRVLADCASGDPERMHWEDVPITRTGQETKYVSARNTPIPHRDLMVSVVWDTTDRKRAEEERLRLESRLQHVQHLESLSVLAGGVAHDFNNLLCGVLGHTELASDILPPGSPAREYLKEVEAAASQAARLSKQMLAYSGSGTFLTEPTNLSRLVEETMRLVKVALFKNAPLTMELGDDLPPIQADPTQISQVLTNLVVNASESLNDPTGLITITTGVLDASEEYLSEMYLVDYELPEGRYVYLQVADTGCGMDDQTKAKVFEPFLSTKFTGRGLGLAASLGIIRGHRGAVRVDSTPGEGSTFTVLFPALEGVTTGKEAVAPPPTRVEAAPNAIGTILVADDEPAIRSLTLRVLQRAGFAVLLAENGDQAVELFKSHAEEIAAVLLDLTMPGKNGDQVFREIHPLRPEIPVLMSSGFSKEEASRRFEGMPIAGFLQKPYRLNEMVERIRQILG